MHSKNAIATPLDAAVTPWSRPREGALLPYRADIDGVRGLAVVLFHGRGQPRR